MKNLLLRTLGYVVNEDPEKFKDGADGITLSVNGMLISGVLIPRDVFYANPQNTSLKYFIDIMDKNAEEQGVEEEPTKIEDINYLHLKDACYYLGGNTIPTNGTNTLMVLIDSVDAFNMGHIRAGD